LGFDAVGITTAEPVEAGHVAYFQRWLDGGNAAAMAYMHRNIDKRFAPAKLLTGAKSVICVALNYRPMAAQASCLSRTIVRIANFAQYDDYHPFIKDRLFQLAEFIETKAWSGSDTIRQPRAVRSPQGYSIPSLPLRASVSKPIRFKVCVDSVPIAERALAQRAGLGFIGRNHMLIHPELGSQILLGELITTLELKPDKPLENLSCGECGRCIRACPTGALGFDGSFDARKCISYQTIEAGNAGFTPANGFESVQPPPPFGVLPLGRGRAFENYIFGCDECILACPHERNAPPRQNMDFQHHPEWQALTPDQIQNMTEEEFVRIFAGSGFIRLGLERLKRNCRISQGP